MIRELDGIKRRHEINAVGIGDVIKVPEAVVVKWTMKEILEGICEIVIVTEPARIWTNMYSKCSWYRVCRHSTMGLALIRIEGQSVV